MGTMSTCSYGLGYVHEEAGPEVPPSLELLGATRPDLLPKDAMGLAMLVRAIMDQGPTSSCVANALSQASDVRFRKLGIVRDPPSRKAIYDGARTYAKDEGEAMVDEGCSAILGLRCMAEEGVPTETDVPLDYQTINQEIDFAALKKGTTCFIAGWWKILQSGTSRPDAVAHAIAKNYPVVFAMSVDKAFENYEKGQTVTSLKPDTGDENSESLGWHMVACLGYRTRPDGAREFLIVNSWSPNWGDGGCAWMHEAVIASDEKRVKAFYVIEVLP